MRPSPEVRESQTGSGEPIPFWSRVFLIIWSVVGAIGAVWWMFDPFAVFVVLGAATCWIVTLPLTRSSHAMTSPWTIVALTIYIGTGLRGLAISARFDTGNRTLDALFLLGQPPGYFFWPGVLYFAAFVMITAAYMVGSSPPREAKRNWLSDYEFRPSVVALAVPLAMIGFLGFVLYIQRTGGLDLSVLSAKRTRIKGLDLGADYSSHGVLLLLNGFSAVAFWIVTAHFSQTKHRIGLMTSGGFILIIFGLNAIILPVYTSSRTDAMFTLLIAFGVSTIIRPRRVRPRTVAIGGVALLLLLAVMTQLRAPSQDAASQGSTVSTLRDSLAEALVYNRNFGDIQNTSHIVRNVPSTIPYQDGKTITAWALAPVPRSVWPSKPLINIGPVIGYLIYGNERTGVPPGLVGDLWLNFSIVGVLVGSLFVGWVLRRLESWRRTYAITASPGFALVYVPVAITFTKNVLAKGIGSATYNSAIQFAVTLVCLWWVGTAVKNRRKPLLEARAQQ